MGVGGHRLAPAALHPGKTRYPLYRWAPGAVCTGAENLDPPPGFDPRTVEPVSSRYIDYAVPAHTPLLSQTNPLYALLSRLLKLGLA
jgi:hypothetical protein